MSDISLKLQKIKINPNKKMGLIRKQSNIQKTPKKTQDEKLTFNLNTSFKNEENNKGENIIESENKKEEKAKLTLEIPKKTENNNESYSENQSEDKFSSVEGIISNKRNNNILHEKKSGGNLIKKDNKKGTFFDKRSSIMFNLKNDKKLKNDKVMKNNKKNENEENNNEIIDENMENSVIKTAKSEKNENFDKKDKKNEFFGNSKIHRPDICNIKQKFLHKYAFKSIDFEKSFSKFNR